MFLTKYLYNAYIPIALLNRGRQPVTLIGGAGCGARGSGFVSRTLGGPRDPALRTLRSVREELAGPPEQCSLRAASAAPGPVRGLRASREIAAMERCEAGTPAQRSAAPHKAS